MKSLFQYQDYKEFLNDKLDQLNDGGRGSRARLSRAVGCQTAYTAQVLRGASQFSLEQGESINVFLGHTEDEGHYFLLLLQLAKAGTSALRNRFLKQVESLQDTKLTLKSRLAASDSLAEKEQFIYYSSWLYGAVHALASIPGFQSVESISKRLGIDLRMTNEIVEFLTKAELLVRTKTGALELGRGQIHLSSESPMIARHHLNWRLQAMQSIERNPRQGLHYSSVVSISKSDGENIKEKFIAFLKELKTEIRQSKEEEIFNISLDFFQL